MSLNLAPLNLSPPQQPAPTPLKPSSSSWSTLDHTIVRKMSAFLSPEDARVIPCVCKKWQSVISGGQTPQRALGCLVDSITIFASKDHSQDQVLYQHLQLLSVKPKRITFLEGGSVFERPQDHCYSLEEFSSDHETSLNSVVELVLRIFKSREPYYKFLTSESPSNKKKHFDDLLAEYYHLIKFLYQEPYFKKIVLNENFKTYNPHKLGLNKAIPWEDYHRPTNPKQTIFLKELQLFFRLLDEELPKFPLSTREDYFEISVKEQTKHYATFEHYATFPVMDMSILLFIAEYAAVAKTTAISKKLKEKSPFNVNLLFDMFYSLQKYKGLSKEERFIKINKELNENLFNILNGFHRSTFMARKVVSKLQLLGKKEGVNLKDYSLFIYVGRAHLDILKEQLSACSHKPIQIKDPAKEAETVALEVQKMSAKTKKKKKKTVALEVQKMSAKTKD